MTTPAGEGRYGFVEGFREHGWTAFRGGDMPKAGGGRMCTAHIPGGPLSEPCDACERDEYRARLRAVEAEREMSQTCGQCGLPVQRPFAVNEHADEDCIHALKAALAAAEARVEHLEMLLRGLHNWHGRMCSNGKSCAVYIDTEAALTPPGAGERGNE